MSRGHWAAAFGIVAVAAAVLLAMGRPPICTCGTVRLWAGAVNSPENSQQLSDWYSLSHIVHGLIFYFAGWLLLRGRPVESRFVAALAVEASWEAIENSPWIIERYRHATMALGYTGDSVINSMSDIAMMAVGFAVAARLPWKASLALGLALELVALAAIRDNLTLNVLMLLWPIDAIRQWQAGA
jgi:hypothetical protein